MDTETLTRERAYLLWEQAGRPEGRAEEFWLAALASLAAETAAVAPSDSPKTAARRRAAGAVVTSGTAAPPAPAAASAKGAGKAKAKPPVMMPS